MFGEYSVLLGSRALSIPFSQFTAMLSRPDCPSGSEAEKSNHQLKLFFGFLTKRADLFGETLDLAKFGIDVSAGLFFKSTIPVSYGLGSSGALCAAVFSRYGQPQISELLNHAGDLARLRNIFVEMESFFHGKSSGFDPLVIFMNTPLCLNREGNPAVATFSMAISRENYEIFLVDTGRPGHTGSLVPGFLTQFAPDGLPTPEGYKLSSLAGQCIDGLMSGDHTLLWEAVEALSVEQFEWLRPMIPEHMNSAWSEGISTGLFRLKLCGSGGGGYLLGFTRNSEETSRYFASRKMITIPVALPFNKA